MQYRYEILYFLNQEFKRLSGEIECDESYFGGRKKGIRGRGSRGKIKVFGMLERKGRIFTTVVDNVAAETLMNEIRGHSEKGSVFYTDRFRSYKSLKFYGKHTTIDHGNIFVKGRGHINGLEGFWSFAKERFLKYHGVSKDHFLLYLKEMEFRYNYRKQNIYHLLIKIHFGPFFN
jgi:transposase